ncbi:MAG: cytochrome oxidase subunit III [Archangium gephyra]|uniref:Cytochrome oxidase subunit III n=1 Tax=Archangium gephyra TaxID=48 RepID=A0A2W5SU39_9BACT|nr:MAG: cytochrome oxidase subunit III [Archangium gephyra]
MSSQGPIHEYDGIKEEDNHLPNWWLMILFGTIVYGFGYWLVFHTTKSVQTHEDVYRTEIAALKKARQADSAQPLDSFEALLADPAKLEEGKKVFASTCASCHAAEGQGLVGPNLTDRFWLHGNSAEQISKSVTDGFPEKGMPPWGGILGPDKVRKVTAWVLAQKGKNLAGKEPQGDPLE